MFTSVRVAALSLMVVFFSFAGDIRAQEETKNTYNNTWAISIDNDLFSPLSTSDSDFTGGFSFSHSGDSQIYIHEMFDKRLSEIDGLIPIVKLGKTLQTRAIEIGLYGFTPNGVESHEVLTGDRPYASLLYATTSRSYQSTISDSAWSSSLSVGVLGLGLFGSGQNSIHNVIGSKPANGWRNQVSDGGELTLRYQLAYMDYWSLNKGHSFPKVKTTYFSSVGYITEVGLSISSTSSVTSSFGSRFNPELISYGEKVNDIALAANTNSGSYFWGGVSIKARLYNAFLQGQFKSSRHTLAAEQLEKILLEAWVGYTYSINNRYKLSYVLRGQTAEVKSSEGGRKLFWGALVLSHKY